MFRKIKPTTVMNTNFSVNVELNQKDFSKMKKMIIDFIKERAEEKVISHYRPKNEEDELKGYAVKIGDGCQIKDPSPEDFKKLLDFIDVAEIEPGDESSKTLMTISFPLI